MSNMTLSAGTAAQLRVLGIPAKKHNCEDLRRIIPDFDGIEQVTDIEAIANVILYLSRHNVLPLKNNDWKSLPWGTHACLFYKTSQELEEPFRNYFKEGLLNNERCIWIIPKSYRKEEALQLINRLLIETGIGPHAFEIMEHQDWYQSPNGRFRSMNEIMIGWMNKIEEAVRDGYTGVRVAGDAYCSPEDLRNFFAYEKSVNDTIGVLKIKALCAYCIPQFAADQITEILDTHQSAFGDFAICSK